MPLTLGDTVPDFAKDSTHGHLRSYDRASDEATCAPFPDGWQAAGPYVRTVRQPA